MKEDLSFLDVYIVNGILTPPLNVIIDESGISQNFVVLKDKVVNIGVVPITVTIGGIPFEDLNDVNFIFQEETDCPGVCPGDNVVETPVKVEAVIIQPIPNALISYDTSEGRDTARVKIILRTTLTVTRPVTVDKDGHMHNLNDRSCETPTTPIILPGLPGIPVNSMILGNTLDEDANSTKIKKTNNGNKQAPNSE
ncbi:MULTISPECIES: hypothetical protein [Bacillaceae]|uniref:hypothetical protein n=1 Tax=Bacillaceae TaxID=186817 RepID=UPI0011A545D2|nr:MULTISPECIES: hypothetical protein [Bacillaceae]MED4476402.1 hypothetical protein [Oceanobacillus caeni]